MKKRIRYWPMAAALSLPLVACGWKNDQEVVLDPVAAGAGTANVDSELYIVSGHGGRSVRFGTITVTAAQPFTVERLGIDTPATTTCDAFEVLPAEGGSACHGAGASDDDRTELLFDESCIGIEASLALALDCVMPQDATQLVASPGVNPDRTVIRNEDGERMAVTLTTFARVR